MIFETHAHHEDKKFDADRIELLSSMKENRIGRIINVGSTMATTRASVELAKQYDFMYAAVGVHPSEIEDLNEDEMRWLENTAKSEKDVVAIGEIGLDYYWDKDPAVQEKQVYWFERQLELARQVDLPVIIHSRDAAAKTMEMMKSAAKLGTRAVIHCYSYSAEQAKEYVKLGYYIGVGGVVTFKNGRKLQETVEAIPMDRILLETDCPYMAPEPFRGRRNDSTMIPYIVEKIAEIKGISTKEVEDITWDNACRLFGVEAPREE